MQNTKTSRSRLAAPLLALVCLVGTVLPTFAAGDLPTRFENRGSVAKTRHNMTQRQPGSNIPVGETMDSYRNNYGEVCVYCHTPHGSNTNVSVPLWNRTVKATTYTTYAALGTSTLTQTVTQPGSNSLSCLSCHDGQVAIDSVINKPGSGGYQASQATSSDPAFLAAWVNPNGPLNAVAHGTLDATPGSQTSCLSCHSPSGGLPGSAATDFTVFAIGTDLRNDHPIGVKFPAADQNLDFNQPTAIKTGMRWFDNDGNGFPDNRELRLYDTGEGFEVECASCHDPHGVPSGAPGSTFNPTFLRVPNAGSAVCLTCHAK